MVIEINKDIDKYQESVTMGLTAKQLIFSIAAVLAGGVIVLLTYKYVGLTGSAYIAIPIVAPIALGGFYTFQGMSFYEATKRRLHFLFGNKELAYISTEGENAIKKLRMEEAIEQKQKEKLNKKKRNKKDLKKSSGAGL
jgi:hypothetical protein